MRAGWRRGLLGLLLWGALTAGLHQALATAPALGADFWTVWLGARALFVEHQDPYGPDVTLRSQMGIYGRPARPGEDPVRFAYPLFAALPLAPLAWLPYDWAYAGWLAFHLMAMLALAWWAFPRLPRWVAPTVLVYFPVTRNLLLGQYSLLIMEGTWLAWGWWQRYAARAGAAWGAGLAFLFAKPQEGGLWALLGVWAASRRRGLAVWRGLLVGTMALLVLPMAWQPRWPARFVAQALRYWHDNPMPSALALLTARLPGGTLGYGLIAAWLLAGWLWLGLRWRRGRGRCLPWLAYTAWLTTLLHPQTSTTGQGAYVLPLWVWLQQRPARARQGVWGAALFLPWALLGIYFRGYEPPQVAWGLLAAFGLWTGALVVHDLRHPPAREEEEALPVPG